MVTRNEIGRRIRIAREEAGLTQGELGNHLGVSHAAISDLERGILKKIDVFDLEKIARILGKPMAYFLGRETGQEMMAAELRRLANEAMGLRQDIGKLRFTQSQEGNMLHGSGRIVELPIYGSIPAGWPEDVEQEQEGTFPVPASEIISPDSFWLRVHGWSLTDVGVLDGELVLVDPGIEWVDGDIVAIRLENGLSCARIAYHEKDGVRLECAHGEHPPIYTESAEIYGVVTKVLKTVRGLKLGEEHK